MRCLLSLFSLKKMNNLRKSRSAGRPRIRAAVVATLAVAAATAFVVGLTGTPSAHGHDGPPRRQTAAEQREARELTEKLRIQGPSAAKQSVRAALARDAERRRDLLNELADADPGAVLDLALDPSERAALPSFLQAFVEQTTTREGELRVLHIDYD